MVCTKAISGILESPPPPSPLPTNLSQLWVGPCDNFGFALLHLIQMCLEQRQNTKTRVFRKIDHLAHAHCGTAVWVFLN